MAVKFDTKYGITWCPGCPNFTILDSIKLALTNLTKKGYKKESFAMTTGIGCHGKIFDYLDISGIYGLHGRALPTATGMKLANPKLNVIVFEGDGDAYSEGLGHFVSIGKINPNITLFVHDNQSFSLTTGQATPTSQEGYKSKAEPLGKLGPPLNPLALALASNVTFVARTNARDLKHTSKIMEKAIKHKGFSFVEIIQDCIVFNLETNLKDKRMYKLPDKKRTKEQAMKIAMQYDYNLGKGKIPLGIIYEEKRETLEESYSKIQK
ncbi:2-oxoacid:ferredoxin oxidoreductase subunit beta [Candidatus Pacearchaeota archaeon]|nr:2-oxoacid:ferredoxin oxidoreductase subunit beta [Candidatus Pacearchaeota archaeon]